MFWPIFLGITIPLGIAGLLYVWYVLKWLINPF